jgi:hypothetical protein
MLWQKQENRDKKFIARLVIQNATFINVNNHGNPKS